MPNDLHRRIVGNILERYDQRLIDNFARGVYVERMIAFALDPEWQLPATAWEAWDLEHSATGARMEVKQSAAQQVMLPGFAEKPGPPSFSIAKKKGYYNPKWTPLNPPCSSRRHLRLRMASRRGRPGRPSSRRPVGVLRRPRGRAPRPEDDRPETGCGSRATGGLRRPRRCGRRGAGRACEPQEGHAALAPSS